MRGEAIRARSFNRLNKVLSLLAKRIDEKLRCRTAAYSAIVGTGTVNRAATRSVKTEKRLESWP
jgi:hypothetical protein